MTTKRRKLVAIILLAVIGGVIAYSLLRQDDEPKYQGRLLSDWLDPNHDDAKAGVRRIGTNALPYLLKWIDYEAPAWRTTIYRTFRNAFPERRASWYQFTSGKPGRRAWLATWGFEYLGTNAVSAIPALEALMKDAEKPESSRRAICALGYIGESAIPVLRARLFDSNQTNCAEILSGFRVMAFIHGTNACMPILIEALNHGDPSVRTQATNILGELELRALSNTAAPL